MSSRERFARFIPRGGRLFSGTFPRILLGVVVIALAAPALVIKTAPVGLVEGEPAPRTYRANRQVQFEDADATEQLRDAARAEVSPALRFDAEALDRADERIAAFFAETRSIAPTQVADVDDAIGERYGVRPSTVRLAASLDEDGTREAQRVSSELVTAVMIGRFDEQSLDEARQRVLGSVSELDLPSAVRRVVADVGPAVIRPTVFEDETATEAARERAAEQVSPVVVVKQAGENIVVRGEVVTKRHLDIMASLGLLEQRMDLPAVSSIVALLTLLIVSVGGYFWRYERDVWDRFRFLSIIATLFLGMVILTRATLWLFPEASPYMMPVPLAAMLGTLLISPMAGLVVTLLTASAGMLLGFTTGLNVVAVVVASIAAVVAMTSLTQRRHLVYAGMIVVGATVSSAFVATLASGASADAIVSAIGYAGLGGTLSVVLAYGLLPFFEHVFGVTTDVRLLELSSPAAPLLRELMSKAPGTYSHSVLAGSLAETAADAVGANPLLARVGAYYHDIGKMNRPVFFAENLNGESNPHDDKTPWLSASIITAHVRDGLAIAERHKLPGEVVDIIKQHHGDSLVAYFYRKAADSGQRVFEEDFRYPGERPQSPEAALVMLADSVEAAVRAATPSLPEIEKAVREVVRGKVSDGQLDDSQLTLAQIETVVQVYAKMLVSIYHPRVKYPSCPIERVEDAGTRYEPSRS